MYVRPQIPSLGMLWHRFVTSDLHEYGFPTYFNMVPWCYLGYFFGIVMYRVTVLLHQL